MACLHLTTQVLLQCVVPYFTSFLGETEAHAAAEGIRARCHEADQRATEQLAAKDDVEEGGHVSSSGSVYVLSPVSSQPRLSLPVRFLTAACQQCYECRAYGKGVLR